MSQNSETYMEAKKHPYSFLLPHIFGGGENFVADQERIITELRTEVSKYRVDAKADVLEQKKMYEQKFKALSKAHAVEIVDLKEESKSLKTENEELHEQLLDSTQIQSKQA